MNKKSTTSNLKILILVLSSKTYPSSRNKKAIKKTWGSNLKDNFEIMFYESGETEKIIDNTLFVETDTSSKNLGYKLLLALDWCTKNTDYDFIFRTNTSSFVNTIELENFISNNLEDLCASIQESIVSILIDKIYKASLQTGISNIAIAGGVSANSYLRKKLTELGKNNNYKIYIPKFEYCTDNAAMIAIAGKYKFQTDDIVTDFSETASARLSF